MPIELLYFEGCPSHERYLPRLRRLLAGSGHASELALRRVESCEAAKGERFLGSPSVRVDGVDIEPGADLRTDFGLTCRLYPTPDGHPADAWVLDALDRAGQ